MNDDGDDKDDTKRKSRNLSEKKRRDQFNMLVNELSSMVSSNSRKMDKSTVLKSTIAFLKNHNEDTVRSRVHEIHEDWKPSFLSNEEFTHLILEALDGFIMVFSSTGKVFYVSESITSLLGHLPTDLMNMTVYDMVYEDDQPNLYSILLNPSAIIDPLQNGVTRENQVSFTCHLKREEFDQPQNVSYELVQFTGYFRSDVKVEGVLSNNRYGGYSGEADCRLIFVGTGRLVTPQLIREMSLVDSAKSEFTSRHSLEWKFLFLDHRAPPIIGYLPFEVLGTSGYDYYHFDDLEKVVTCHEALMLKGEGTSCFYRFLTKGQQFIWLQTRFYITYHQWNSKPEFVVCTHRVVSYADVIRNTRGGDKLDLDELENTTENSNSNSRRRNVSPGASRNATTATSGASHWSTRSTASASKVPISRRRSPSSKSGRRSHHTLSYDDTRSDSTSMSTESRTSRQSTITRTKSKIRHHSHSQSKMSSPGSVSQSLLSQPTQMQANVYAQPSSSANVLSIPHASHQTHHRAVASTFMEPLASQYVDTIAVQPVITSSALALIPTNSDYVFSDMVLTPSQDQVQHELTRKHDELQHLIHEQQEELKRVSQQLVLIRQGLGPAVVTYEIPHSSNAHASAGADSIQHVGQQQSLDGSPQTQQLQLLPQQLIAVEHTMEPTMVTTPSVDGMISYMQLLPVPTSRLQQIPAAQQSTLSQHQTLPLAQSQQSQNQHAQHLNVHPYNQGQHHMPHSHSHHHHHHHHHGHQIQTNSHQLYTQYHHVPTHHEHMLHTQQSQQQQHPQQSQSQSDHEQQQFLFTQQQQQQSHSQQQQQREQSMYSNHEHQLDALPPFQMTQEQAQVLFSSSNNMPQSGNNPAQNNSQ